MDATGLATTNDTGPQLEKGVGNIHGKALRGTCSFRCHRMVVQCMLAHNHAIMLSSSDAGVIWRRDQTGIIETRTSAWFVRQSATVATGLTRVMPHPLRLLS
eukprot:5941154-Amphidinium_carterae.1